jgi:RNA polymerase sigma factor (sigma-70 family)
MYLDHLDTIDRICESLCRRNGVIGADAEDFASDVKLKLLQDDYAVLRKYRGASSTATFLTVVIANLFRDYRVKAWGKWRPSAEARRRGQTAVLLETAVYRDQQTFDDACRSITQNGRVRETPADLRKLLNELPHRAPRRVDDPNAVDDLPASSGADDPVLDDERDARLGAASEAVLRAVSRLDPEDRLIIRMHFFEGLSIAEVARGLQLEQKPLYPRLKRLLERLSAALVSEGIGAEYVQWLNLDG